MSDERTAGVHKNNNFCLGVLRVHCENVRADHKKGDNGNSEHETCAESSPIVVLARVFVYVPVIRLHGFNVRVGGY